MEELPEVIKKAAEKQGLKYVEHWGIFKEEGLFSFDGFNEGETLYVAGELESGKITDVCFIPLGKRKFLFSSNMEGYLSVKEAIRKGYSLENIAKVLYGSEGIVMESSQKREV